MNITSNDTATEATVADSAPLTVETAANAFADFLGRSDRETDTQTDQKEVAESEPSEEGQEAAPNEAEAKEEGPEPEPEADAEPDEDTTEDAEDGPAPNQIEDMAATVKFDDGQEITVEELRKGYLRQSDYTRKRQQAVSEQQEAQAKFTQEVTDTRQRIATDTQSLRQYFESRIKAISDSDPVLGGQIQSELANLKQYEAQQRQAVEANQKQLQDQQQEATAKANLDTLQTLMPELWDTDKAQEFSDGAVSALQDQYGFTSDEATGAVTRAFQGALDPRELLILKDAIAYRKLQADKPKAEAKAKDARPMRKSKRQNTRTTQDQRYADDVNRLRKTGRPEDAAAAFLNII